MMIIHENKQIVIENDNEAFNKIFKLTNEITEKKELFFSHLLIDGVEVYENHEEYIKVHLKDIVTVEISTQNLNVMFWETMESINIYIQRALPALTELVHTGYENFSSKSWKGINQLVEGMQWIFQFMNIANTVTKKPSNWKGIESSFQQCESSFSQLLEAVEVKDTILILDIISYEITPAYKSLKDALDEGLKDEEYLSNVN